MPGRRVAASQARSAARQRREVAARRGEAGFPRVAFFDEGSRGEAETALLIVTFFNEGNFFRGKSVEFINESIDFLISLLHRILQYFPLRVISFGAELRTQIGTLFRKSR